LGGGVQEERREDTEPDEEREVEDHATEKDPEEKRDRPVSPFGEKVP
jgi:hypothetical protein